LLPLVVTSLLASAAHASVDLIAIGTIDGAYEDLAAQTAGPLENGIPGNRLGGIGSDLAYAGGTTFLVLLDRGPNANSYNSLVIVICRVYCRNRSEQGTINCAPTTAQTGMTGSAMSIGSTNET
jgi:hypothetical protein